MDVPGLNLDLIKKYNVPGPRYTSYPTAVQFKEIEQEGVSSLKEYVFNRNQQSHPISLYFHIPFCFSLCWYCGCTKVITKDQDRGDIYLDYLENEMDQVKSCFIQIRKLCRFIMGVALPLFCHQTS